MSASGGKQTPTNRTYTREEPVEEFMDSFDLENYYKY